MNDIRNQTETQHKKQNIGSNAAHLNADNFDARLAGVVIGAEGLYIEKLTGDTNITNTDSVHKIYAPTVHVVAGNNCACGSCDTDAQGWYDDLIFQL